MSEAKPSVTVVGALIATVLGVIFLIMIAEVFFRFAQPNWREFYSGRFMGFVALPGQGYLRVGKPNFDGYFAQNNGDFRIRIRINDNGLRNTEPLSAANGQIWVVGDSMAFGWGVEHKETYTELIQSTLKIGAYNLAAPGNDVCGYQRMINLVPKSAIPKAVIVGLILENDVITYDCPAKFKQIAAHKSMPSLRSSIESLGETKRLLTDISALYNFLAVTAKRINVVNEVMIALGIVKKEHAYRRIPNETDTNRIITSTVREIEVLRGMVPKDVPFGVLIAPSRFEIRSGDPYYQGIRISMVKALKAKNFEVIDPVEGFLAAGFEKTHFAHDGHWNAEGHKIAAGFAVKWLKKKFE